MLNPKGSARRGGHEVARFSILLKRSRNKFGMTKHELATLWALWTLIPEPAAANVRAPPVGLYPEG